jgi:hypothetical protein
VSNYAGRLAAGDGGDVVALPRGPARCPCAAVTGAAHERDRLVAANPVQARRHLARGRAFQM